MGFIRRVEWVVRVWVFAGLTIFVILPAIGTGFAVWLFLSSIQPEAAAAEAYRNAAPCGALVVSQACIKDEQAALLALYRIPGRWGSRTDRLNLQLGDGVHDAEVSYDVLAPWVSYETVANTVRVREYQGRVTTVYSAEGKPLETTDSPTGGASAPKGTAVVMVGLLGPWLILCGWLAIRHPGGVRDIGRLLRDGRLVPRESIYNDRVA